MLYEVITNTQPAIYLASAVIYEIIKRQGFKDPDYFIGHSVITSYSIHYTKLYETVVYEKKDELNHADISTLKII